MARSAVTGLWPQRSAAAARLLIEREGERDVDELKAARERIDRIDGELARLFGERMAAAAEIAAVKREQGLPVRDPAREREVLERTAARLADPALRPRFAALMEALMAQSREYQKELLAAGRAGTSIACPPDGTGNRQQATGNTDAAMNTVCK